MRRIPLAALRLMLLLLTAGVSCLTTARVPDREYRIGYMHLPPYAISDGQGGVSGFSIDLTNEGARRAGLRLRWVKAEEGAEAALSSGAVDLWPQLTEFSARSGAIHVTQPFGESFIGLAVKSGSPVKRVREFGAGRLAHGAALGLLRMARTATPEARLLSLPTQLKAVEAFCQGRADGVLVNFSELAGSDWPAPACGGLQLRILQVEEPGTRSGVAASLKNPGAAEAADRLRLAYDEMLRDGTLNGALARWFGPSSSDRLLRTPLRQGRRWNFYLSAALGLLTIALAALTLVASRARRARIEAEAARQQATLANRAQNDFLATLSHELRTPMNGVIGMAEALSQSGLNEGQKESLGILRRSSEALLALIDDLLDFAKVDAGRLRIDTRPFELWTVLEESVLLMETQARQQGLELRFRFPADLPQIVVGDSRRLRQVALNLVSNAVKFTPEGSITVSASVSSWSGPEARVRVAVTDTGIGIESGQQHMLFQRFSQLDTTLTRQHGGTGLGLAIAKELVRAMGGSIGVESELGRGSTFWFELPYPTTAVAVAARVRTPEAREIRCRPAEAAGQLAALLADWGHADSVVIREEAGAQHDVLTAPIRPSLVWRKLYPALLATEARQPLRGRILLVEDNEINERVASALLRKLGLEVEVARNGVECLSRWAPDRFDAILMDCTMPVMDGLEATRQIRAQELTPGPRRTPIIALTATALEQARLECLAAGMDDFVTKPVRRETLEPLLAQWLTRHRQPAAT